MSNKKEKEHPAENEMLLEALFGRSGNPVALASGLEAVLQTLAMKVFDIASTYRNTPRNMLIHSGTRV